jgi:hypothetical protein
LSILAAAGAAALAASAALGDGVVIDSSSDSHAVGERVEVGAMIEVEDGAEVTVLDRSGVLVHIPAPGARYEDPDTVAPARGARRSMSIAARLAMSFTGFGRRAGLGTMRGGPQECRQDTGSRSLAAACSEAAADAAPAGVSVWASFNGAMTCDYALEEGEWRRLPLGQDGGTVAIAAATLNSFSVAEDAELFDAAAPEDVKVRCQAVDSAVWSALAPHWRDDLAPDDARALMRTYAALRGGTFAEVLE